MGAAAGRHHSNAEPSSPDPRATARPDRSVILPNEALSIAREWFEALRQKDAATLARLTSVPSRIRGFNLESGSEADACGAPKRGDGLVGVRTFDGAKGIQRAVENSTELADALRCLFLDGMLIDYIPVAHNGAWPTDRGSSRDGAVGSLTVVTSDQVAPTLAPYRGEVDALMETHLLVQAHMTDNNGVTNHVLLAIPSQGPARVAAVYIHELFEC